MVSEKILPPDKRHRIENRVFIRKLLCALLSMVMVISANAWSDTPSTTTANIKEQKTKKVKKCCFPKSRKRAPNWICDAHADTAVGSAAKSAAGVSFMEQMAVADARAQLAQRFHGTVHKATDGKDGDLITKTADGSLLDTALMESAYGPDGTLYVLIGIGAIKPQAQPPHLDVLVE